MTLESYLILACLLGSSQGCSKAGEAYYVYSGYDTKLADYAKRIQKQNKELLFTVSLASSIAEKKVIIPLTRNKFINFQQTDSATYVATFSWNFD